MIRIISLLFFAVLSGACTFDKLVGAEVTTHGYQFNEEMLQLVPAGSSREHVLLSLGTPNTTQIEEDGNETFYYITQKKERKAAFLRQEIIEQTVMAINFDSDQSVTSITNYGLEDGEVFAFNRRVTPSSGKQLTLITQLLLASRSVLNPLGGDQSQ